MEGLRKRLTGMHSFNVTTTGAKLIAYQRRVRLCVEFVVLCTPLPLVWNVFAAVVGLSKVVAAFTARLDQNLLSLEASTQINCVVQHESIGRDC